MFGEPKLFDTPESVMFDTLEEFQAGEKHEGARDRRAPHNEYATLEAVNAKLEDMLVRERLEVAKLRESLLYAITTLEYPGTVDKPWQDCSAIARNLRKALGGNNA